MANPLSVITKPLSAITSRGLEKPERGKCASRYRKAGLGPNWPHRFRDQNR